MKHAVTIAMGILAACGNNLDARASQTSQPTGAQDAGGETLQPADDASAPPSSDGAVGAEDDPSDVPEALVAMALAAEPAAPPADSTNRFADDPEAARFGRTLFFDGFMAGRLLDGDNDGSAEALGKKGETGKVACSSCHVPADDFSDTRSLRRQISLGAGWGKRRAPSLLDVAHSPLLTWDGRHDTLYNQIFGVIENPVEMNSSRLYAAERVFVKYRSEYEALFGPLPPLDDTQRFPTVSPEQTGCSEVNRQLRTCIGELHGLPGDGAEYDGMAPADQDAVTRVVVNIGKALGAYQRLLSCGESRFDRWARGDDPAALTASERRGARLFAGKGNCVKCHSGTHFSDERFHNVGLKPAVVATVFLNANDLGASGGLAAAATDPLNSRGSYSDGDDGRLSVANPTPLEGAFRTPKLRCIAKRPSFMHTAQIRTLSEVIAFFDRGGDPNGYPGTNELKALGLTADERADLAAFLLALEGSRPNAALLSR